MPASSVIKPKMFNWAQMDKVAHVVMYAILSLTMLMFLQKTRINRPVIFVLIFCICWGIGIELLQSLKIINRDFEIADIIANIIGTFAGIAITKLLNK